MSIVNKAIAASLLEEVWINRNYCYVEKIMGANHTHHNAPPGMTCGPEGYRLLVETYHAAFPDLWMKIDFQVAENNLVTTRWRLGGTQCGDFVGFDPSESYMEITGIQIDRIEGGKIVETWSEMDLFRLFHQIGAMPIEL